MSKLNNNTTNLQSILETINNLPEANNSVELPELINPATVEEVFLNEEVIDANGNKQVGTFAIDSELSTQDNLITQLQNMVDNLPEAGGVELPILSNPATSDEILDGYEAIDEDGSVIVGTHVCEGGSGGDVDFGYGSFTIYNPTELIFAVNGVVCYPDETTTIPISDIGFQSFLMTNWDGWTIEEMYFLYSYEGDDGEIIEETVGVVSPGFEEFIICGYIEIYDNCTFGATYS